MSAGQAVERVAIGIGANLGDAEAAISAAVGGLAALPGSRLVARSSLYRTAPVGGPAGQPDFLNAAAVLETTLEPLELLDRLQELEQAHGRVRDVRWGPRTLDLDILLFGRQPLSLPRLEVPHPRLAERRFALEPLLEAWPEAALPDGRALAAIAAALPDQGVERLAPASAATIRGTAPSARAGQSTEG